MIEWMMAAALAAPHGPGARLAAPPPDAILAAYRAVGSTCGWRSGVAGPDIAGFGPSGVAPVRAPAGGVVVVRERDGRRFAFLARLTAEEPVASCRVADVAVLPPAGPGATVAQCVGAIGRNARPGAPGWVSGIGVKAAGSLDPVGFWIVSADGRRLQRVDLRAVGLTGRLRCREPQPGD